MLTDIIPARFRRIAYALFAAAGVIVGALNIADVNTGKATDVLTYLGVALGLTAAANTSPPKTGNDEDGAVNVPGLVWLLAGIALALVILELVGHPVHVG